MSELSQLDANHGAADHKSSHSQHRVPMTTAMKPLFVLMTVVALAACGQAEVTGSRDDAGRPVSAKEGAVLEFGMTAATAESNITVSEIRPLSPGANSWWVDQDGQAIEFTVTLKNTGNRPFEPYLYSIEAQAGAEACELIYDSEIGLDGAPLNAVAKGESAVWRSGYLCAEPSGAPLVVSVSEDTSSDPLVQFAGSLP
jgi:hypothetical protein